MIRKRHNNNIRQLSPEELRIKQWKTAQYFELGLLNYIDCNDIDDINSEKYTNAQAIATEYIERCEEVPEEIRLILLERKRLIEDNLGE